MQKQQKKTSSKKKAVKTYLVKASKPSLPGSVARLKIKEKTILTGVFSKYSRKIHHFGEFVKLSLINSVKNPADCCALDCTGERQIDCRRARKYMGLAWRAVDMFESSGSDEHNKSDSFKLCLSQRLWRSTHCCH
ncbi:unnamed protein product [Musa textilis]